MPIELRGPVGRTLRRARLDPNGGWFHNARCLCTARCNTHDDRLGTRTVLQMRIRRGNTHHNRLGTGRIAAVDGRDADDHGFVLPVLRFPRGNAHDDWGEVFRWSAGRAFTAKDARFLLIAVQDFGGKRRRRRGTMAATMLCVPGKMSAARACSFGWRDLTLKGHHAPRGSIDHFDRCGRGVGLDLGRRCGRAQVPRGGPRSAGCSSDEKACCKQECSARISLRKPHHRVPRAPKYTERPMGRPANKGEIDALR